ncbi:hypothetical protein B0H11DRAFT_1333671 [Mycena galericulata]|nr:hypothetical protein B0H11DRAFT_1333671 [Mycena galericulata]
MVPCPPSLVLHARLPAPRLPRSILAAAANDDGNDDDGVVCGPGSSDIELASTPRASPLHSCCALLTILLLLLHCFLHAEVHGPLVVPPPVQSQPNFDGLIPVKHCAIARFYTFEIFVMQGDVPRVHLEKEYLCALVYWLVPSYARVFSVVKNVLIFKLESGLEL